MAQKHFSLVKHLCGFVISFLGMNENGAKEKSHLVLQPQLLKPLNERDVHKITIGVTSE